MPAVSRELRPRKSRPSYASMLGDEDSQPTAGPSKFVLPDEDDSGSEFAPEEVDVDAEKLIPDMHDDEACPSNFGPLDHKPAESGVSFPARTHGTPKRSEKVPTKKDRRFLSKAKVIQVTPGLSCPPIRQMWSLPTPSVHHRHRAIALFSRSGRVERLEFLPPYFGPVKSVLTNTFTHNVLVTDRVNKAWGYNVGSGPLWELMEDRGWYKEAILGENDLGEESNRRPIVYKGHQGVLGCAIVNSKYVCSPCFEYRPLLSGYLEMPLHICHRTFPP
jgi:transcription factor C subunit 6